VHDEGKEYEEKKLRTGISKRQAKYGQERAK
jgi:hypothetical protein